MKNIINFINEKQNFIIKGHTTKQLSTIEDIYKYIDSLIKDIFNLNQLNYNQTKISSTFNQHYDLNEFGTTFDNSNGYDDNNDVIIKLQSKLKLKNIYKLTLIDISDCEFTIKYKFDNNPKFDYVIYRFLMDEELVELYKYVYNKK